MSDWNKATTDDIEIDNDAGEVNILVTSDEWGNVYLTLRFEQVIDIASQIKEICNESKIYD